MANERIHVVTHDDGWAVKWEGKSNPESVHATQKEAIDAGSALAQKHEADLVVHRQDGTFRNVLTYEDGNMSKGELDGRQAAEARENRTSRPHLEAEDVVSVGSRISWGAVLGGAAVALSILILLAALGAAAGISARRMMSDRSMFVGAVIWYIFSVLVSLFVGGFAVSRITAGEDKTEAMTYGVVLWGVMVVAVAVSGAWGVNTGMQAIASGSQAVSVLPENFTEMSQDQLQELQARVKSNTPAVNPTAAGWCLFAGLLLSLGAAVGGSLAGAGPSLVLRQIRARHVASTTTTTTRTQAQVQHQ